jgi:hypothetical protein
MVPWMELRKGAGGTEIGLPWLRSQGSSAAPAHQDVTCFVASGIALTGLGRCASWFCCQGHGEPVGLGKVSLE